MPELSSLLRDLETCNYQYMAAAFLRAFAQGWAATSYPSPEFSSPGWPRVSLFFRDLGTNHHFSAQLERSIPNIPRMLRFAVDSVVSRQN